MVAPKWNPETKKMEFPKPEPGKSTVAGDDVYMAIPKATINRIAKLAKADGAQVVEATTPQGEQAQCTRLAKPYIMALINDLLSAREAKAPGK